ncbi:MAG: hypothetical protein NWR21_07070 [Verrucomicrobiales bacterium]|jgi:uncharacterized membrane protein|nr:hypothetical protein [Verrucomicrobiales bacterium]MDP4939058.1 hypothetical protein [Verrucomicrobiales bacterium]MDP5007274.1 hypothetical protein [Verrucomicrobiales bacterium]
MKALPDYLFHRILLAHFAATCSMSGVIWVVQLVIYPQFSTVGAEAFPAYHRHYTELITLIVGPLMLIELAAAFLIFLKLRLTPRHSGVAATGLGAVILLWLITAFVQVPVHEQLGTTYNEELARHLVLGNWLRTLLWTLRIPLAWSFLAKAKLRPPRASPGQ